MFRFSCSARCQSSVTQLWQSLQIGGHLSGLGTQETRGQTKLAHQRVESTLQAISYSSLQWIGSPTGGTLWLREGRTRFTSGARRRMRWSSDVLGVLHDKVLKGRRAFSLSCLHKAASLQTADLVPWTTKKNDKICQSLIIKSIILPEETESWTY